MSIKTAAEHAYTLLVERHPLVVIDVETTPSTDGDHVIQVAALTYRQGRLRDTYATNVNPGVPILNTDYHGIDDDDVAAAPTFAEIADDLEKQLADADVIVVGHNPSFDISRINLEYERAGLDRTLPDRPLLDTQRLPDVVGHVMPSSSRKLAAVCKSLGIVNTNPHNATSDATATGEVLHALLQTSARNGQVSLSALHAEAGGLTIASVGAADAKSNIRAPRPELPAKHVKTHSVRRLGKTAADSTLDRWVAQATECVELRCRYLEGKATDATHHAERLHERLTALLVARHDTLEPGQGATLMAAMNVLARHAMVGGSKSKKGTAWWRKHRERVAALARCTDEQACPDCAAGHPCPIDIAHQPIVTAILYRDGGQLTDQRRKKISGSSETAFVTRWSGWGCYDLAGYAAWLAADSWAVDGNERRAAGVVDHAMEVCAYDPRILRVYAQRLALHGRHAEVAEFVTKHLEGRTTDPGWDELAVWFARYQARRHAAARREPGSKPRGSTRTARPAGRSRPRRFSVRRS